MTSFFSRCITVLVATLVAFFGSGSRSHPSLVIPVSPAPISSPSHVSTTSTNALVIRVVDGDTFVARVDGQAEDIKVRLLGVNTPESVDPRRPVECFGKEASHFAAQTLDGWRVRLDEDVQADDRDKYGRVLRNVIRGDGMDFNATLVRQGYAYAYLSFPLNKQRKIELKRLQEEARRSNAGLWDPRTCDGKK